MLKHEQPYQGKTNVWLTPREYIIALGPFDLDPCAAVGQPWETAKKHYTIKNDGLRMPWSGRVWMNPPYGPETYRWMTKLAKHNNGIALIFARTETKVYSEIVWPKATSILFVSGRINFCTITGEQPGNAGVGSAFIAFGHENDIRLKTINEIGFIKGKYFRIN